MMCPKERAARYQIGRRSFTKFIARYAWQNSLLTPCAKYEIDCVTTSSRSWHLLLAHRMELFSENRRVSLTDAPEATGLIFDTAIGMA